MKKLYTIISCMTLIAFSSCSKDDDFNKIVGEWLLVDLNQQGEAQYTDGCWQYIQFTFSNNNKVYTKVFNAAPSGCESSAIEVQNWEQTDDDRYLIKINNEVISKVNFENNFLIVTDENNTRLKRKYRKA